MRPLEVNKYLYDIVHACELLNQWTSGKTLTDYSTDAFLRSAVERQFEIIGEALVQAIRLDTTLKSQISDTAKIIGFRNRLIHAYASLAHDIVWGIIEVNLPILQNEIKILLGR